MSEQEITSLPAARPVADPQTGSPLFQLPQEIRDQIYAQLFLCTPPLHVAKNPIRLEDPYVRSARTLRSDYRPPLDPLALLYTCRRAFTEIGDSWLGSVTFCFEDSNTMLDKLTAIDPGVLGRMRRLCIMLDGLYMPCLSGFFYGFYPVASALVFLPGLRLDTLIVNGTGTVNIGKEQALDMLVREGSGWKELNLFIHSHPYGQWYTYYNGQTISADRWQRILETRDGASSGPSVTTSCSKDFDDTMCFFEEAVLCKRRETIGNQVVARRRDGADYEVKADSPLLEYDVRRACPGLTTWREVREHWSRQSPLV